MFDRLDDLLIRYEELLEELNSPDVAMDQNRFRKLMKEQADLTPLVDAYKEYKKANQDVEDSLTRRCVIWPRKNWPMRKKELRKWSSS